MSIWLSSANQAMGTAARGQATGAAKRQIAATQADAVTQIVDFWSGKITRPPARKRTRAEWQSESSLRRGQASLRANTRAVKIALKPSVEKRRPPAGPGQWVSGVAIGASRLRRFRLYRPPDVKFGERLPRIVMLHGWGQDAKSFATSTRMNRIAAHERFLVLCPEQDRMSNAQGCWNWFDTSSGRAYGEAALIMKAIDQICLMYPVDRTRVAVAGHSAGASMAALLVTRHPDRFRAVVMHSGIPPGTAHSPLSALGAMHGHRATKPRLTTPATMASSWPSLMVIHGSLDRVVAASNGHAAVQAWTDAAGARAAKERSVQRGSRYPTNVTGFKRRGHTVATLVEVLRDWSRRTSRPCWRTRGFDGFPGLPSFIACPRMALQRSAAAAGQDDSLLQAATWLPCG